MSDDFGSIPIKAPDEHPEKDSVKKENETFMESSPLEQNLLDIDDTAIDKTSTDNTTVENDDALISSPPPEKAQQSARRVKKKKGSFLTKTLFLMIFLFACYCGAGYFGVPYLMQKYAEQYLALYTDLKINKPFIKFDPFRFTLDIDNLELRKEDAPEDEKALLSIPKIYTKFIPKYFLEKQLVSEETKITDPDIFFTRRDDESYNFMVQFFDSKGKKIDDITSISFEESPLAIAFNNIQIENGSFLFIDEQSEKKHVGKDINIALSTVGNFISKQQNLLETAFSARINDSLVEFTQNDANTSSILCNINDIDLAFYASYLPVYHPFTIKNGRGSGSLEIIYNKENEFKNKFALKFILAGKDIALEHNSERAKIQIPRADIEAQFQPFSKDLSIKKLALQEADVQVKGTDSPAQLGRLLPKKDSSLESILIIDEFSFEKARFTLQKTKKSSRIFEDVSISLKNYDSQDQAKAQIHLSGKNKDHGTQFSWDADIVENKAVGQASFTGFPIEDIFHYAQIENNEKNTGTGELHTEFSLFRNKEDGSFQSFLDGGKLELKDVTLYTKDHRWLKTPSILFQNISFDEKRHNIGDIIIENGEFDIQEDSLPSFFTRFTKKNEGEKQTVLTSLQFQGKGLFKEKDANKSLPIESIDINAKKLDQAQVTGDNLEIALTFAKDAKIKLKGRGKLYPFSLWLDSEFENLPTETVFSWFKETKKLTHIQTDITGKGIVILPGFSFKGDFAAGKGQLTDKNSMKWKAAEFTKFAYEKKKLSIDALYFDAPDFVWERSKKLQPLPMRLQDSLSTLLQDNKSLESLQIHALDFADAKVSIYDKRYPSAWKGAITKTSGSIEAIDSTNKANPFVVNLKGLFAGDSYTLQGNIQAFSNTPVYDYVLRIPKFSTKTLASKMSSLRKNLPKRVSLKIYEKLENQKISTRTSIKLLDTNFRSKTAALAVALLRGRGDKPTLTIYSSNKDPQKDKALLYSISNYVKRLLVKAEVSPFALTKNFTDLGSIDGVEFRFGQINLTNSGQQTLLRLRDFLKAYPYVNLSIIGDASAEVDGAALQDQLMKTEQKRVDALNKRRMEKWEADQKRRAAAAATATEKDPFELEEEDPFGINEDDDFGGSTVFVPIEPQLIQINNKMLTSLANRRSKAVRNVLVNTLGVSSKRVRVEKRTKLSENSANAVQFRVVK